MNSLSFTAACIVTKDPEGFCHLVGFADKKHGTEHYLMLQRSFAEDKDEQDEELGMDTYHVEWSGPQSPCYGGIAEFVLKRSGVEVTFKREGAQGMNSLEHMSIDFDLSASEYEELKAALTDIFAGDGCFEMTDSQAARTS